MSSSPEDFPKSSVPTAGTNPNDAGHLAEIPFDTEPISLHYDKNHTVNTDQLEQIQTGEYWSERPPARELPTVTETVREQKSKKGLWIKLGAAAGGLALVGGGLATYLGMNSHNDENQPPQPTPSASAPVTPGTQEATPPTTPAPEKTVGSEKSSSIELKAGQTPEALAKNLFEGVFPRWNMASANQDTTKEIDEYVITNGDSKMADYYKVIAQKNTSIFIKALFIEGSTKDLPAIVAKYEEVNTWVINMYDLTSHDEEPYKVWNAVQTTKVVSKEGTKTTIQVNFTEHDNSKSGLNHADKLLAQQGQGAAFDGNKRTATITFDSASGSEKILSLDIIPQS